MFDKQALLNLIKQSMPKVIDIEIISNKYVKCYESEDLFGNQNIYYTNDLDYWLAKLEDKT